MWANISILFSAPPTSVSWIPWFPTWGFGWSLQVGGRERRETERQTDRQRERGGGKERESPSTLWWAHLLNTYYMLSTVLGARRGKHANTSKQDSPCHQKDYILIREENTLGEQKREKRTHTREQRNFGSVLAWKPKAKTDLSQPRDAETKCMEVMVQVEEAWSRV